MFNIVHRVGIESPPDPVFEALSTKVGVASWWAEPVSGEFRVGSTLQFRFFSTGPDFNVLEVTPNKRVLLRCVDGPEEWLGTHLHFDLSDSEGQTVILFKHSGWRDEIPFMHHSSSQWAYLLFGLKAKLEGGQATPFGAHFRPISRWSPGAQTHGPDLHRDSSSLGQRRNVGSLRMHRIAPDALARRVLAGQD